MTPLLEGVTPAGLKLDFKDYVVQLNQYGDFIQISDVVEDTHEDPILSEATQICRNRLRRRSKRFATTSSRRYQRVLRERRGAYRRK